MEEMKETERTEFKQSLVGEDEIIITAVAMANTAGGKIYLGIDDRGRVIGATIGKNTIENLVQKIVQNTKPQIMPSVRVEEREGKEVIVILVEESSYKPIYFKGIAYKRIGKVNVKMSPEEIEKLIIKKYTDKISFDKEESGYPIEEIEEKLLKNFVVQTLHQKYSGKKRTLQNLGLLIKDKVTKGAILLFGKQPYLKFPQSAFKCIKIDEFGNIISFKTFEGVLFDLVEQTFIFVKENLPQKIKIEGTKRKIVYSLPLEAIREAIVNAVVHRDYTLNSFCYLTIRPAEVEIKNPGSLPEPLRISDLYKEHPSILRNPIIARIFNLAGYIEQWGSGTKKIVDLMRAEGLEDPVFKEDLAFFYVTLTTRTLVLDEKERKIIEIIKKRRKIKTKQLSKLLKCPLRTTREKLDKLIKKGYLQKIGSKKTRKYLLAQAV